MCLSTIPFYSKSPCKLSSLSWIFNMLHCLTSLKGEAWTCHVTGCQGREASNKGS